MNSTFFKYISTIVIMSLLILACKKSAVNTAVDYRTLKVVEIKTDIPVANASVVLYKCIRPNSWGCLKDSVMGILTTDKDGNFQFDSKLKVYLIRGSHSNYWDGSAGGDFTGLGYVYLTPVAYTKIHLKKINMHPPELLLHIILNKDPDPLYFGLEASYNLTNDSTVVMKSYGNNDNHIIWDFTDKAGTVVPTEIGGEIPNYYINRFDTASVEINY